jgi:hypothetical protein
MLDSEPTGRVAIGGHVLEVGSPSGMLITPRGAVAADSASLAAALEEDSAQRAPREVGGLVDDASTVTGRIEDAVELFTAVASGAILSPREFATRIEPMLALLTRLDRAGRWEDTLRLARAVDGVLALALRWVDLVRSLSVALRAARALGDELAVAWGQHQLGTLHLVAGDLAGAEARLAEAHEIRQRLADRQGLAATEQSLQVLCKQLRGLLREGALPRGRRPFRRLGLAAAAGVLLLLLGTVAGAAIKPDDAVRLTARVEGRGNVTGALAGIRCPSVCDALLAHGRRVSLVASARRGSTFVGWDGDCAGTQSCHVLLDRARAVTARFDTAREARSLTVHKDGGGEGRVTSSPSGIDCGPSCSTSVARKARIRLIATPGRDARFAGWRADGCAAERRCMVTVLDDMTVTARFEAILPPRSERRLAVAFTGGGSGRVTSVPPGISCPQACSHTFHEGDTVVLTAAANPDSEIAGWSTQGCAKVDRCTVTLGKQTETVTAAFDRRAAQRFTLTTRTAGLGAGTIAADPPCSGQPCGYDDNTVVTLTATPASDTSSFAHWDGCTPVDVPTCKVTMAGNRTVEATFDANVE